MKRSHDNEGLNCFCCQVHLQTCWEKCIFHNDWNVPFAKLTTMRLQRNTKPAAQLTNSPTSIPLLGEGKGVWLRCWCIVQNSQKESEAWPDWNPFATVSLEVFVRCSLEALSPRNGIVGDLWFCAGVAFSFVDGFGPVHLSKAIHPRMQ